VFQNRSILTIALAVAAIMLPTPSRGQFPVSPLWTYTPITNVTSLAYSPDGSQVVFGGKGSVQLFNSLTGSFVRSISTSIEFVDTVAISPDGKTLAIGGGGTHGLEIWSLATGQLLHSIAAGIGWVHSVAFSPDGQTLATGGLPSSPSDANAVQLWNVASGKTVSTLKTKLGLAHTVVFSHDGKSLAAGGNTTSVGLIEVWNLASKKVSQSITATTIDVHSVAFTPDGKSVAAGGVDGSKGSRLGKVQLWSVSTGKALLNIATGSVVNCVKVSPDGSTIAAAVSRSNFTGDVELFGASRGKPAGLFNKQSKTTVTGLAYSPNGKFLSGCGYTANQHGPPLSPFASTWSLSENSVSQTFNTASFYRLSSVLFSADGRTVIAGTQGSAGASKSSNGAIQFWDSQSGKLNSQVDVPGWVQAAALSPDGKTLGVSWADDSRGVVELRNASSGGLISTLEIVDATIFRSLAFSPDGSVLAAGGSQSTTQAGAIHLFNIKTAKPIGNLKTAESAGVNSIAFSPDGKTLAAGGSVLLSKDATAGVVELWDPTKQTIISSIYPDEFAVSAIAFSPSGGQLSIGGIEFLSAKSSTFGVVEAWDVASAKLSTLLTDKSPNTVRNVTYSPDGKVLFVAGYSAFSSIGLQGQGLFGSYTMSSVLCNSLSRTGRMLAYTTEDDHFGVLQNPILSIDFGPAGASMIGTVTLSNPAPTGGITVYFLSSDVAAAVQSSVTVPAGKTSATFTVQTTAVKLPRTVSVTGYLWGFTQSGSIALRPPTQHP